MNFSSVIAFFKHSYMLAAIGVVAVIALISAVYYYESTRAPSPASLPAANSATGGPVTASGTVAPLTNPDLSFAASGRIAYVGVSVGDRVYAGETLASLDLGTLSAQRAQAQANQEAAEARLDALMAPPRSTDVAVRQAAVDQASQTLNATYASLPASLSDAYAKANDAVHIQTDTVFSSPNTSNPSLVFSVSASGAGTAAIAARVSAGAELTVWQHSVAALPVSASDSATLDAALTEAIQHLMVIRSFEDATLSALSAAVPTSDFSSASIAAAQSSVSSARTIVNGLISSLTASKQSLVSERLAIQAAQASLDQLNAGASSQDIAAGEAAVASAKASVAAISAQIANNVITAPFSGTVGSVSVKAGELAAMNAPAITLVPDSGLDVEVFVSELDAARITTGDSASVTVDAYGAGRIFPAHVASVDSAPSAGPNGVAAYEVKLAFDTAEPDIKTGMTANAIITPSSHN